MIPLYITYFNMDIATYFLEPHEQLYRGHIVKFCNSKISSFQRIPTFKKN